MVVSRLMLSVSTRVVMTETSTYKAKDLGNSFVGVANVVPDFNKDACTLTQSGLTDYNASYQGS